MMRYALQTKKAKKEADREHRASKFAMVYVCPVGHSFLLHSAFGQCKISFVESVEIMQNTFISLISAGIRGTKQRLSKKKLLSAIDVYNMNNSNESVVFAKYTCFQGILKGARETGKSSESVAFAECRQALANFRSSTPTCWSLLQNPVALPLPLPVISPQKRKENRAIRCKMFILQYKCVDGDACFKAEKVFDIWGIKTLISCPSPHNPLHTISFILLEKRKTKTAVMAAIAEYNLWFVGNTIELISGDHFVDGYISNVQRMHFNVYKKFINKHHQEGSQVLDTMEDALMD